MSDASSDPAPESPEASAAEPFPTDGEIDGVLAEFGGDARKAIGALLQDLATLAGDFDGAVSRGFVRAAVSPTRLRVGRRP